MNVQIECIWKKNESVERAQAISLWNRFNTFSNEEVTRQRANEIAFVAIHQNNVVGLTTVRPLQVKLLNNNFFYEMRIFISPDIDLPHLLVRLTLETKKFFESNREIAGPACIGMIAIIENEKMNQKWRRAVWPVLDFVFAGFTPKGHQLRVSYFKHAKI